MKFSPIFIIPEQERNTTPDIFLTDQYGKDPAPHGDGPLKIDQAIRLSKIVNRIVPAFGSNNSIIYGFLLESVYLDGDDLYFKISDGTGIIDKTVFILNYSILSCWKNFKNIIPPNLQSGQILLYFGYKDSITNNINRPYPQKQPISVVNNYPEDQFDFDPISINTAFYNSKTKEVVNSEWDLDEQKILITASIFYERNSYGNVKIWTTENKSDVIVIKDGEQEKFEQQAGGFNFTKLVDGGSLSTEKITETVGINVLLNEEIVSKNQTFELPYEITDTQNLNIFCNGIKYRIPDDVLFENGKYISLKNNLSPIGKQIYAYQQITNSSFGSLNTIYSEKITQSEIIETSEIIIDGISVDSDLLIFYNGILLSNDDVSILENKIIFLNKIKKDTIIEVIKINTSRSYPKNIEVIYDGEMTTNGSSISVFNLNPNRSYLVFYNGIFYNPKTDYTVGQNTILFKDLFLLRNRKIKIIGV